MLLVGQTETTSSQSATPRHDDANKTSEKQKPKEGATEKMADIGDKVISQTEETTKRTEDAVNEETVSSKVLKALDERVTQLEKVITNLHEKLESVSMTGVTKNSELEELVATIQGVQTDMEKFNQIADRLIDDRENRELHLNVSDRSDVLFCLLCVL